MNEHSNDWRHQNHMSALDLLFFDTVTPLFKHARVVELTGVNGVNLQNWISRGVYNPSFHDLPKKAGRLYSAWDLGCVMIANKIMEFGANPYHAFGTAEIAFANFMCFYEEARKVNKEAKLDVTNIFTLSKAPAGLENYLEVQDDENVFITFWAHRFHEHHRGQQVGFIIPTGSMLLDLSLRASKTGRTRSEAEKVSEAQRRHFERLAEQEALWNAAIAPTAQFRMRRGAPTKAYKELLNAKEALQQACKEGKPEEELRKLEAAIEKLEIRASGINRSTFIDRTAREKPGKVKNGGADAKR